MNNRAVAFIATLLLSISALPLAAQTLNDRLVAAQDAIARGQEGEAKAELTKALQECRQQKDTHGEGVTLLFLGITETGLNNVDGGRALIEEAKKKMQSVDDSVGIWMVLLVQSQLEKALGSWPQALAHMEEAVAVITKAKLSNAPLSLKTMLVLVPPSALPPGTAEMLEMIGGMMKPTIIQYFIEPITHDMYGGLLTDVGQLEKAEAELNAAREGAQLFGGMYDFSIAAHFGDLRYAQKRYDEARAEYQKALSGSLQTPLNPLGDQWIRVGIYDRLARLEGITGHIDAALGWSDKALEITRAAKNPIQTCVSLETRGGLLMRSERFAEAETAFNEAMKFAGEAKNGARQASVEADLGNLKILKGDYGAAVSHLERSVQLYRSLHDPISEAAAWGSLSIGYMLTDNVAAAEGAIAHARTVVDQSNFTLGHDMIAMQETWIRFRKGQATTKEVDASLEQFLRNAQSANIEIAQDVTQIFKATTHLFETGDFVQPQSQSNMPSFAVYNDAARGIQLSQAGNYEDARKTWQAALEKNPSNDMRVGLLALIGGSYWKENDFEQAGEWFSQAVKSMETVGANLRSESMLMGYLGSYHRTYYDVLIEALLRAGRTGEAFETSERARARAFLRLLGNHRLKPRSRSESALADTAETLRQQIANWDQNPIEDKTLDGLRREYEAILPRVQAVSPEYASMTSVEPLKLDAAQKELPANTTLISYYITPFGIQAWIVDAETLDHVRLNVEDAKLRRITCWTEEIGRTRSARATGACDGNTARPDEAYDALIAPLRGKIHKKRLLIIPNGVLHYVPFAALYDATNKKYLVQDFPISYAPSASTLRFLRAKEATFRATALILGDPATSLPDLSGARKEAIDIAEKLHTRARLGAAAKKSLLYGVNGRFNLLHIASHVRYDAASPLFSAIELAAGAGKNGALTVDEIQSEVDLKGVNLVVLTGCESGLGKRSGGDEVVGLTRAILYAGSPAVISTLWSVNDAATTPLIDKFYDHFLKGDSAADALRNAQVELLTTKKYGQPYYWAAFLLTGNPTTCWARDCSH